MIGRCCAAGLLAVLLSTLTVNAAEVVVRVDPADAVGVCNGLPTSAECASGLFFACAASQDAARCARVGLSEVPRLLETPQQIDYLIERVSTIQPQDVTEDLKHLTWFRAGFRLVEALARRCPPTGSCADESWENWQIYLRAEDDKFFVVYWRGETEPDQPPEIPDMYRGPSTPPAE